jgi:hypothetical protein
VRLELSSFAPGVAPDAALAWWFDFREGATDHTFLGARVRRVILARSPDVVEMEDRAPFFRERTRAQRQPGAVVFTGYNGLSRFRGEYRFEADVSGSLPAGNGTDRPASPDVSAPSPAGNGTEGDGTRVTLRAEIDLRGPLKAGLLLARPMARAILRRDLEGHVEDMVREHGRRAS